MGRSTEQQRWPRWWLRWALAILFIGVSWGLIQAAYCAETIVRSFVLSLIALSLLIVSTILLLPEALALVTAPFTAVADALFFPRGKARPPGLPYYYRLIDSFRTQERWDDLADVCEEVIRQHPEELVPYQELFEIYADCPEDAKYLARLRRKARKHLSEENLRLLEAQQPGASASELP